MNDNHEIGPLLKRVLAGDGPAMEVLLGRIRPYIHLLVQQQVEPDLRHKLGDSDLVQETLVRVYAHLDPTPDGPEAALRGTTPPEFLAWVGQIARNLVKDATRRGKTKKRDWSREMPGSNVLATLVQGDRAGDEAERAERTIKVAAALRRLSDSDQTLLRLRFFENLTHGEIGKKIGLDAASVRLRCFRAVKKLRDDREIQELIGGRS